MQVFRRCKVYGTKRKKGKVNRNVSIDFSIKIIIMEGDAILLPYERGLKMNFTVTVLPGGEKYEVKEETKLLTFMRELGIAPEVPCGGQGTCGKCKVLIDGKERLACITVVDDDMVIGG